MVGLTDIWAAGNPDLPYMDRLHGVTFRPVYIIGLHRSGTSILYRLLAGTGCFNIVTLLHVLNRRRLLQLHFEGRQEEATCELLALLKRRDISDRGFDRIAVNPDSPVEYGYALEHQGRRPALRENNIPGFIDFCKKLQVIQDVGRPLLLKNPFDTLHFADFRACFEGARFILIARNPVDVVSSQIKAIRHVLEARNEFEALLSGRVRRLYEWPWMLELARCVYSSRYPILYHQVSKFVARNCDYLVRNAPGIAGLSTTITYNELCQQPRATLACLLSDLGLTCKFPLDFESIVHPRARDCDPETEEHSEAILTRNATFCRMFGV
jgi:hypothetical protein